MILFLTVFAAVGSAEVGTPPKGPAEAIALADADSQRGVSGVYRMKVAAAARGVNAVYLNSSADYRAPDDLTFHLTLRAAKTLEKRLGAKPEVALLGKTVIVRGVVKAVPIANTVAGRPASFNRYQHSVLVEAADQLTVE
jgi:hypothetical protein